MMEKDGDKVLNFASINIQVRAGWVECFPAGASQLKWPNDWRRYWFYYQVGASLGLASSSKPIHYTWRTVVAFTEVEVDKRKKVFHNMARRLTVTP